MNKGMWKEYISSRKTLLFIEIQPPKFPIRV